MQRTIELDVTDAESLVAYGADTELGHLTFALVSESGPAGGNPVVSVTGEGEALLFWLLRDYTDGNLNNAMHYLGFMS